MTDKYCLIPTSKLYAGKLVIQYRKSEKARFTMNIVVYFKGVLLNPDRLFRSAQGIASKVNKFPQDPNIAMMIHLNKKE